MRNFRDNRGDNRGGGGGRFGKRNFGSNRGGGYGGGDRGRRDGGAKPGMHAATCNECGRSCEVPFRPTGDRPIFCSECFGKQQGRGNAPREKKFDRPRFENKRPDFRTTPAQDSKAIAELTQQLEVMNNKLERILNLVMQSSPEKEQAPEKTTEVKPKKAKAKKTTTKKKK